MIKHSPEFEPLLNQNHSCVGSLGLSFSLDSLSDSLIISDPETKKQCLAQQPCRAPETVFRFIDKEV